MTRAECGGTRRRHSVPLRARVRNAGRDAALDATRRSRPTSRGRAECGRSAPSCLGRACGMWVADPDETEPHTSAKRACGMRASRARCSQVPPRAGVRNAGAGSHCLAQRDRPGSTSRVRAECGGGMSSLRPAPRCPTSARVRNAGRPARSKSLPRPSHLARACGMRAAQPRGASAGPTSRARAECGDCPIRFERQTRGVVPPRTRVRNAGRRARSGRRASRVPPPRACGMRG